MVARPASAGVPPAARPRILVTNDDGIDAPGLRELVLALEPMGEIYVCSPSGELTMFCFLFILFFRRFPPRRVQALPPSLTRSPHLSPLLSHHTYTLS